MPYNKNIGSRTDVMNGKALKTSGGLYKKDLKYNKFGKIVSVKMSNLAKKNNNLKSTKIYKKSNIKKGGLLKKFTNIFKDVYLNSDINLVNKNISNNSINYIKGSKSKSFYKKSL